MDQNPVSTNPVMPAPTAPVPTVTPTDPVDTSTSDTSSLDTPAPDIPAPDISTPPAPEPDTTISNPAAASAPDVPSPADSPVVTPDTINTIPTNTPAIDPDTPLQVAKKITEAHNVLIALSGDPSVDEMAAAIGLSLYLDKLGKRATAIYSGATPNALEFLKPEDTFESSADTLQDFVIALNKDKADHLRYKLDGEYVKIFITPYKTRIDQDDLEFSYGDFNVDLVLALDVANGIDLDAALREHGRIMHDAVIINITTGNPGRFGEIEWSDKSASSVSEMIAKLLYDLGSKVPIDKEEATAFLTGIVAATDRFSNTKTTPGTMQIASKLMESGANQQLISKNITPDVDNELYSLLGPNSTKRENDPTKLDIKHNGGEPDDESKEVDTDIVEAPSLLDDLKAAEASLATAGAETVPDSSNQPIRLDDNTSDSASPAPSDEPDLSATSASISEPAPAPEATSTSGVDLKPSSPDLSLGEASGLAEQPEKIIQPPADLNLEAPDDGSKKYGKMLEDVLSGLGESTAPEPAPIISENPAAMTAPEVQSSPEINGIPEINYMPLPGEEVLPPPPAPPIDMSTPAAEAPDMPISAAPAIEPLPAEPASAIPEGPAPVVTPDAMPPAPSMPAVDNTTASQDSLPPLGAQPAMQDQVYVAQAADPSAFKIPGM